MKRVLKIDYDTDREDTVRIGPIQLKNEKEISPDPVLDMTVLCEAVCTMIHVCHQADIQKDSVSIKQCLAHIQEGFAEAGYKGILTEKAKREMKK
jgi:hypothetical protein